MVILGGLLAPAQRRLGTLMAYAALVDSGAALMALGIGSRQGLVLSLLSLLMRPFGLVLMAAGIGGLRASSGGADDLDALRGSGWRAPWSTAALLVGGLSAAGLPVSAGFVGRWALGRALTPSDVGAALILLLAGLGIMIGIWRGLTALLARPGNSENEQNQNTGSSDRSEGGLRAVVVAVAIAGCVVVGLFPQILAPLAIQLVEVYTFFTP